MNLSREGVSKEVPQPFLVLSDAARPSFLKRCPSIPILILSSTLGVESEEMRLVYCMLFCDPAYIAMIDGRSFDGSKNSGRLFAFDC